MRAVCGNSSETHIPLRPCRANCRRVPISRVPWLESIKANRFPSMNDCGIGWPFSSTSFGLWSKSSSWLGPPAIKR